MEEPSPSKMLHLDRSVAGAPAQVFDAWTVPAVMRQWLFTSPHSDIVQVNADLRVGGGFSILERPHDLSGDIDHFGEYLQIDPPHRLAFTFQTPAHFPERTRIAVVIKPRGSGSQLDFIQTGVDPAIVRHHWVRMLGELDELLRRVDR